MVINYFAVLKNLNVFNLVSFEILFRPCPPIVLFVFSIFVLVSIFLKGNIEVLVSILVSMVLIG